MLQRYRIELFAKRPIKFFEEIFPNNKGIIKAYPSFLAVMKILE